MNRAFSLRCLSACALLVTAGTGCHYFRDLGTGTHMDAPRDHPHDTNPGRQLLMVVEVTTDAEGNVAKVFFQRSSGKEGIDGYVAESIHENWPHQPSTKSVASLTYSTEKGFSPPKMISSTPL